MGSQYTGGDGLPQNEREQQQRQSSDGSTGTPERKVGDEEGVETSTGTNVSDVLALHAQRHLHESLQQQQQQQYRGWAQPSQFSLQQPASQSTNAAAAPLHMLQSYGMLPPNPLLGSDPFRNALGHSHQQPLPYDIQLLLRQQELQRHQSALETGVQLANQRQLGLANPRTDPNALFASDGQSRLASATTLLGRTQPLQRMPAATSSCASSGNSHHHTGVASSADRLASLMQNPAALHALSQQLGAASQSSNPNASFVASNAAGLRPDEPNGWRSSLDVDGQMRLLQTGTFQNPTSSQALMAMGSASRPVDATTTSSTVASAAAVAAPATASTSKPVPHKASGQGTLRKNKPTRPLSAYNIFFKEERQKILTGSNNEQSPFSSGGGSDSIPDKRTTGKKPKREKPHGKIGFEDMAKMIAQRWDEVKADPNRKQYYQNLADADKNRYQAELDIWKRQRSDELTERREQLESSVGDETRERYFESAGMSLSHLKPPPK